MARFKDSMLQAINGLDQLESEFSQATQDIKTLRDATEKKLNDEFAKFQAEGKKKIDTLDVTIQGKLNEFGAKLSTMEKSLDSKLDDFRTKFIATLERRIVESEKGIQWIQKSISSIEENMKKLTAVLGIPDIVQVQPSQPQQQENKIANFEKRIVVLETSRDAAGELLRQAGEKLKK